MELNILIKNNEITNVNDDGNHIFVSSIEELKIKGNKLLAFIDTVKGSHHIQFRSKHVGGVARLPSTDVEISGNTVTGVPGVAAISDVKNGASGDMMVLRNVKGGRVFRNTLRHGGELGIDVVDSSSDVHVYRNNIAFIDASGIIVGSSLVLGGSPDNRVENVHVYRNTISDVGLDAAETIQRMSKSGIRFWNCRRASAYFNEIYRPGSYGISVRANDADAPEYDVEEFSYGLNNCYEMNGEAHFFAGFNPTINEDIASSNYTTSDSDGAASWAIGSNPSVVNNAPVALGEVVTVIKNVALRLPLASFDADGIVSEPTITQPANGTVTVVSDNVIEYTPDPDYVGVDEFTFTVDDNDGDTSGDGVISINVIETQDPVYKQSFVAADWVALTPTDITKWEIPESVTTGTLAIQIPVATHGKGTIPDSSVHPDISGLV